MAYLRMKGTVMMCSKWTLGFLALLALLAIQAVSVAEPTADTATAAQRSAALQAFDLSPAIFVENKGQWDESVRFGSDGRGVRVSFTDAGPVFQMLKNTGDKENPEIAQKVFSATFPGANRVRPVGLDASATKVNYYIGNDSAKWHSDVPSFEKIMYKGLYEGVDLYTWGKRSGIKYEFHLAPGASWKDIVVRYEGIEGLSIDEKGALHVKTSLGEIVDEAPVVYQERGGGRVAVASRFRLVDECSYGFEITGNVDASLPMVIDPSLEWSSYLGGSGEDQGYGIAVDSAGNCYLTGCTKSSDFPTAGGFDSSYGGGTNWGDAYVAMVTASGTLAWSSYIGGAGDDYGNGIAVDAAGNCYLTGATYSLDFPTVGGFDTSLGGAEDAFVAKVTASGTLAWSSYLGGSENSDWGLGIAVDAAGNCYLTGCTWSSDFPTASGFDTSLGGFCDAYVAQVTTSGTFVWGSYLGGSSYDYGNGIAVDGAGNSYLTGETDSSDFPTTGGFDMGGGGWPGDAFLAKVTASGTLAWSSCLGGSDTDVGTRIAVDGAGNCYLSGWTSSSDFPTSGGFDTSHGGQNDAFVAKVTASGTLAWSSYLGSSGNDVSDGIAVDGAGNCYVTGFTSSSDFPTPGGFDTTHGGTYDAYVAKVTTSGMLAWSSYLGGAGDDYGYGIAVDAAGTCYLTGKTGWSDFPTAGGFDTSYGGYYDAFVTKINAGTAYYVNDAATANDNWCTAAGDDANDGLTPGTPKATVQAVLSAYTLGPGDTVRIDTGTYDLVSGIGISPPHGGSAAAPVTFAASPYGVMMSGQVFPVWGINANYVSVTTATRQRILDAPYSFMKITGIVGAQIGTFGSSPQGCRISRCDFCANQIIGVSVLNTTATIENCVARQTIDGKEIDLNWAPGSIVKNCSIYGNGAGLFIRNFSSGLTIENNIIRADGPGAISVADAWNMPYGTFDYNDLYATNGAAVGCTPWQTYYTLADWRAGTGQDAHSISSDPLFANVATGDFHLNSFAGRYFPGSGLPPEAVGAWVSDPEVSPCIDAGDPASDYTQEPAPNGGRANMGAYGNTEQASKSGIAPLAVATASLTTGQVGVPYSQTVVATGGVPTYAWSVPMGGLPTGLSLDGATGIISGTPTATGTASFTVNVTDSQGPPATATRALSITVYGDLFIVTASLQGAPPGVPYSQTLIAQGGLIPYTWSIGSGSLPDGLSLDTATGVISGTTPTACAIYDFTVHVIDSQSPPDEAEKALHIIIAEGPTYYYIISDNEQSTTNTNYVAKTVLNFNPPTADDWLIFGFCEWKCPNVNYPTYVQMFVDGTGEGQNTRKPVDPTDYMPFISVKGIQLAAGPHKVQLMYRAGNAAAAAYVRNARICAVRKAALEYYNTARDTAAPLTINSTDIVSLNWTPVAAGNYIVISTAELNATTSVSTKLQTVYNGTVNDEGIMRAADNGDYTTFMSFNYIVAPALVPIVHKIAAVKIGADPINHYVRRARILALRLSNGRFNNTAAGYGTEQATTQTTWQQALTTSWTYGVNGNWLFLNSARMLNTSTSYQTGLRVQLESTATYTCGDQLMRPKDVTDLLNYSSIDVRNLTTPRKVDMDFRTTNAAGTAKVRRLRFYGLPLDQQ